MLKNLLKKFLQIGIDQYKAIITREIDRAVEKLKSGQTALEVGTDLQIKIAQIVHDKTSKDPALGAIISVIIMTFDWTGLIGSKTPDAIKKLTELKKRVEGARL
jgi:hypothetical protein